MTYLHNIVKFHGVPRILDLDRQISTESPLKHHCVGGGSIPQKPKPQIKHGMLGNTEIAIEFDDLSIYKPPFSWDISQLAMFDDTRGYIPNTSQYYILGVLYLVKISP